MGFDGIITGQNGTTGPWSDVRVKNNDSAEEDCFPKLPPHQGSGMRTHVLLTSNPVNISSHFIHQSVENRRSPQGVCIVDMSMAMSGTPMPQTYGDGKAFPGSGSGNRKACLRSKFEGWPLVKNGTLKKDCRDTLPPPCTQPVPLETLYIETS